MLADKLDGDPEQEDGHCQHPQSRLDENQHISNQHNQRLQNQQEHNEHRQNEQSESRHIQLTSMRIITIFRASTKLLTCCLAHGE